MSRPRVQSLIKLTYWTFSVGSKPKDFETSMKNIGCDDLRLPCKYENFRKVVLNQLPQNVGLWRQYLNSADQYSLKHLKVAIKLMDILHVE